MTLQNQRLMKCRSCYYKFDPTKEGNSKKRKGGMCCFGDSYSIKSKKEYVRNLLFMMIESQKYTNKIEQQKILNYK